MTAADTTSADPTADAPPVTLAVVVATRDRPEQLRGCLAALGEVVGDAEVVVVDSCSSTPATSEVAARHGATVVRASRPGASRARNLGWRASRAEVVAFVDDDVRVAPGWATAIRRAFVADPDTDFVTGRLGLRAEDAGTDRPVAFFDAAEGFVIDAGVVDGLGHGANLAVRRSALEAVGGFDEDLGPGARWHAAEDLDLLDRLVIAGRRGRYEPAAAAVHVQWRSRRDLVRLEWRYGVGQGARLARLRATDPVRAEAVGRITWRDMGLSMLAREARARHEFAALSTVIRLGGTAWGWCSGMLRRSWRTRRQPATR